MSIPKDEFSQKVLTELREDCSRFIESLDAVLSGKDDTGVLYAKLYGTTQALNIHSKTAISVLEKRAE